MKAATHYYCTSWEDAKARIDALELDGELYTVTKRAEDSSYTYYTRGGFLWLRKISVTRPHTILMWEIEVKR